MSVVAGPVTAGSSVGGSPADEIKTGGRLPKYSPQLKDHEAGRWLATNNPRKKDRWMPVLQATAAQRRPGYLEMLGTGCRWRVFIQVRRYPESQVSRALSTLQAA